MTQYKFRMFDRVRPVKEKAFTIGKVVSQGFGQGHAWYRVTVDSGDVYNCREDEIELVERIPNNRGVGMLPEDVFELSLLRWRTADHHPEEGEGIIFITKSQPHTDVWRGVFKDGKYNVWIMPDDAVLVWEDKAGLFALDEESILCWSGFETLEVPGFDGKAEEDESWADGCGQAFEVSPCGRTSPDAED